MFNEQICCAYLAILKEELLPATGCTEPIAIAYCAAKLRALLGQMPERVEASVSGNILKNVNSVVVPNTNGRKGIPAAIGIGLIAGNADAGLQVIADVSEAQKTALGSFLEAAKISVACCDSPCALDIALTGYAGNHSASVRITNNHTNLVYLAQDGKVLLDLPVVAAAEDHLQDKSVLNIPDIVAFADQAPLELLREVLTPQIRCNLAIAEEGLRGNWGSQIGRTLLCQEPGAFVTEAKAYAAAGSDARMNGCEMPVVILSGSGNQGITASLPIIRFCQRHALPEEQLYRGLAVSDLITVYQKVGIGRLSAYCGAISAGAGAGSGLAYLHGAGVEGVSQTLSNAVAILSGTICDGAKSSCAAKIASAVEAGILGYWMYAGKNSFRSGDGIVGGSISDTVARVGILASQGMRETDRTILQIMTGVSVSPGA